MNMTRFFIIFASFLIFVSFSACQQFNDTVGPMVCPEGTEMYVKSQGTHRPNETHFTFHCKNSAGTVDTSVTFKVVMMLIIVITLAMGGMIVLPALLLVRRRRR